MPSDCSVHVIFRKQECKQGLALALAYPLLPPEGPEGPHYGLGQNSSLLVSIMQSRPFVTFMSSNLPAWTAALRFHAGPEVIPLEELMVSTDGSGAVISNSVPAQPEVSEL